MTKVKNDAPEQNGASQQVQKSFDALEKQLAEQKELNEGLTGFVEKAEKLLEEKENEIESLKAQLEEKSVELESLKGLEVSEKSKKVDKDGNVKVRILLPVAGKFLLPYNVGQVVSLPEKQADEIVETRYGEYV